MKNKKGLELAINYLVVIVLTFAVLGTGFYIYNKIKGSTDKLMDAAVNNERDELIKYKCSNDFEMTCLTRDVVNFYDVKPQAVCVYVNNILETDQTFSLETIIVGSSTDIILTTFPLDKLIPAQSKGDFCIGIKRNSDIIRTVVVDVKIKNGTTDYASRQLTINLK